MDSKWMFLMHVLAMSIATSRGTLTVRFTQQDVPVRKSSPTFNVQVSVSGAHDQDIHLQLLPLTFSQYMELSPQPPCTPQPTLQPNENPAETDDFDTTVQNMVIPATTSGEIMTLNFEVGLTPDDHLEPTEAFLVYLNVTNAEQLRNLTVLRRCSTGRITSTITITNFIQLHQLVPGMPIVLLEADQTIALFNVTKLVTTEFDISITVSSQQDLGNRISFATPTPPQYTLTPNMSSEVITLTIHDDEVAQDTLLFDLTVTATITAISSSQPPIRTNISLLDNEVPSVDFLNDSKVTVLEGQNITLCVNLFNITIQNYQRQRERFSLSTSDVSAKSGVDYYALSATYSPFFNPVASCSTIRTKVNDNKDTPRSFIFGFDPQQANNHTVFRRYFVTVEIMDALDIPFRPKITTVTLTEDKALSISWTAQSDFLHPIERFIGNITIEPSGDKRQRRQDNRAEIRTFNVENSTYKYKLKDFATDKIYTVVICAVNEIGENCSDPWGPTFFPPPTGPLPPSGTSISPGVIAGIVVAVVALILLCCLFLLLLLLLCCKKDSEKAYYPARTERKQKLKGNSTDPDSLDDRSDDFTFYEETKEDYS